jgi:hypothetical protein
MCRGLLHEETFRDLFDQSSLPPVAIPDAIRKVGESKISRIYSPFHGGQCRSYKLMSWKRLQNWGTVVLPGVNSHNSGLKSQLLQSGNLIALPEFRRERIPARALRGHAGLVTIAAPRQFLSHGTPTRTRGGRA